MNWPKILTKERVEPLTLEERGALLTGIIAISEGLQIKKSQNPYLELLLDSVRMELSVSKRNAANGKQGGNPNLKGKHEKTQKSDPVKRQKRTVFVPPTVEEVRAYCTERGNNVNPQSFIDFYTSKGWKVGNQPMRDWKACVRTWESTERARGKGKELYGPNGVKILPESEQLHDLDHLF